MRQVLNIKVVNCNTDLSFAYLETHPGSHLSDRKVRRTCQWGDVDREIRYDCDGPERRDGQGRQYLEPDKYHQEPKYSV